MRTALCDFPQIVNVRGRGLIIGIELNSDCRSLPQKALAHHVLISVAGQRVIRLLPPLIMEHAHADMLVEALTNLIKQHDGSKGTRMTKKLRHFLTLMDLSRDELERLLTRAIELKQAHRRGQQYNRLAGKVMTMLFEKSSTRTRVSAEIAMQHMGGHAVFLSVAESQIKRGERTEDSARVLGRMSDILMMRTFSHQRLLAFSNHAGVPVINGLSDHYHPCQLLSDMMTWREKRGGIAGCRVAWIGDGNNMCHSYINAALQFNFHLAMACPPAYAPSSELIQQHAKQLQLLDDPYEAVRGAHLVVTDTWTNMGQEEEKEERRKQFAAYQVNGKLMACANNDALFMHCLPAHRGDEVSDEVLDGRQSVVWDEAENRLHSLKALLEFLLLENSG